MTRWAQKSWRLDDAFWLVAMSRILVACGSESDPSRGNDAGAPMPVPVSFRCANVDCRVGTEVCLTPADAGDAPKCLALGTEPTITQIKGLAYCNTHAECPMGEQCALVRGEIITAKCVRPEAFICGGFLVGAACDPASGCPSCTDDDGTVAHACKRVPETEYRNAGVDHLHVCRPQH